ncbi:MAG: hypothetical protein RLZZ476_796 [Verrucomicrobiota bacterium]|jgi:hypothetical protein
MSDSFTEYSRQGWLSRIGESFKGILFGIIVIPLCLILLWWNEGRAVTTARSLAEGAAAVVAVQPDKVDAANDKKLVHVTGEVKADAKAVDDHFQVSASALKLIRNVEIYQWVEDKKTEKKQNTGGSEETRTTYTYKKEWVDEPVRSQDFKQSAGHENTGELIADSDSFIPAKVTLGAYQMPETLVARMSGAEKLLLADEDLPENLKERAKVHNGVFYVGKDPAAPQIGDQRVSYEIVKPGPFSIIAAQIGETFGEYQTKAGDALSMIESGVVTAEVMFKNAATANAILTWVLRFGGFLFMSFGFMAIMRPLSVLGSVLPFLGNLIGMGTGLIAFVLAGVVSLVVIAIAWIVVRPVLGIALLVLAVGGLIWMRKMAATKPAQA